MRLLRRISAAFTTVLLLQLTLLGSGTLCTLQGGVASSGMAGMHEKHRAGLATSDVSSSLQLPLSDPAAPHPCDASQMGGGCGQPWAPGQCVGMTTCATVAVSAHAVVAQMTDAINALELPEPADIASSPAVAPDVPPPRA